MGFAILVVSELNVEFLLIVSFTRIAHTINSHWCSANWVNMIHATYSYSIIMWSVVMLHWNIPMKTDKSKPVPCIIFCVKPGKSATKTLKCFVRIYLNIVYFVYTFWVVCILHGLLYSPRWWVFWVSNHWQNTRKYRKDLWTYTHESLPNNPYYLME